MDDLPDTARPRLAAKVRLKWDEVRQQPLLLFPEGVLVLNPTAHEVVALCDGRRTVAEIVKTLGEKFHSDTIDHDVKELLAKLVGKSFVVVADSM
jgi:pyrroloquinoline quinone biosynthesis protein D